MENYLLTIINAVGLAQTLFVALALHCLPGRHKGANRILTMLMLVFALMFAYDILYHNDLILVIPVLVFARLPLIFLYGPLFWLYLTRISSTETENRTRRELLHFVPFMLVMMLYAPCLALNSGEKIEIIRYASLKQQYGDAFQLSAFQQWFLDITAWRMPAFVLQLCVYLVLGAKLLAGHGQRIKQHFSYTEKISLNWVRNLLLGVVGMWLLVPLKEFVFSGAAARWINNLLVLEQVVFVFLIGLFGLLQVTIFKEPDKQSRSAPAPESPKAAKYQSSSLEAAQIQDGLRRLLALMEEDKPYLNSDLTIADLAASLALPSRHVSQIINSNLGKNFMDFVNGYRVTAAQHYLDDAKGDMSILDIAMEVGFNSKSAFNNAFKRHAGMTPTQYRQRKPITPASPAVVIGD